jgi:hypothetical protein
MSTGQHGGGFGTVFHPEPDPAPAGNGGPIRIGQLRPLPRRRRPAMIALAVVLIGAGILGGAELYHDVNHQVPVLLVTASVPVGGTVTSADLTTTSVAAGPGVKLIPARQESQVVGLVATTNLEPGTLLAAADLTGSLPPAGGQVLVPAGLKPSQLPASGLAAGDHVLVVSTPAAAGSNGSSAAAGPPLRSVPAVVEAATSAPDSDGLDVVDLLVPELAGPGLARELATGDVALIVTSRVP